MKEESRLGYDDVVAMTGQEQADEQVESAQVDPFAQFESWAMTLGEASAVQSQDPQERTLAIQKLNELTLQSFPAGESGLNAITSLEGIIEDKELYDAFKAAGVEESNTDVRPFIQVWLQQNAPDVLSEVDFGDLADASGQQEGIDEAAEGKPAFPKQSDYGYDGNSWDEWKSSPGYAEYRAATDAWSKADKAWRAKEARKYDTTMWIMNPHFDVNGPEDEEDPNFQAEELEVGVDYSSETTGEYRAATWGYHGGDPEEHPETEYEVTRVVDIDTGKDLTDDSEVVDRVLEKLDDEQYESIDPKNKQDYERPAIDRKKAGQPPLSMKDVKDKDEKSERDRKSRAGVNVQEVAEFIYSFYDKKTNTFPKGPESVATMTGKKFGEQAEAMARKLAERLAPQQSPQADPRLAEIARIKQLSGM
jgi:hypothetical protein